MSAGFRLADLPRVRRLVRYATHGVWISEAKDAPRLRRGWLWFARVFALTARGFVRHHAMTQAAALTYYTVLSIVPVLAVSFAAARGLGAYEDLKSRVVEPFLDRYLGPSEGDAPSLGTVEDAGAASIDVAPPEPSQLRIAADQILDFVDDTKDLPLGITGSLVLFYAAIKLLSAIERALNLTWGIHRGRSFTRRLTDYVAVVVLAPLLITVGTASTAALRALEVPALWGDRALDLGAVVRFLLPAGPLLVIWAGLTVAYFALPNAAVRIRAAMVGAAVAAVLWLTSQFLYVELQVGIAKYNALYASFAAFPIMLFWIYVSWVLFLLGGEIAYAVQNVGLFTSIARMGTLDHALRESLALRLCGRITAAFLEGSGAPTATRLAGELGVSPRAVSQVLEDLCARDLLACVDGGEEDGFMPARDPDTITVADVLCALKVEQGSVALPVESALDRRVERVLAGLEQEARASLYNDTLRELALAARARESEAEPDPRSAATREVPQGL